MTRETRDEPLTPDSSRVLSDGGSPSSADDVVLDPWGSAAVDDYEELFTEFGIEQFEEILPLIQDPHYLMRRGIIFGHRGYRHVVEAMQRDEEVAALSGFMPTGDPHIGHKMVFDELIWHQQQGAKTYALIADLEAHSARGLTWEEIDEHAKNYLLSLLALGFDVDAGELYRQSTNQRVQHLAFELGIDANFSEMQAIYGFEKDTDISHLQSVITQAADILFPQLEKPTHTVIPVGPDQDPHMRLTRDLAARTRDFRVTEAYASFEVTDQERELLRNAYSALSDEADDGTLRCATAADWLREHAEESEDRMAVVEKLASAGREPLRPRTRIISRRASDDAFEGMIEAIEGEKRVYEAHIDAFELDRAEAEELARTVEVAHGGFGFYAPTSIYHRFITGLTGGKMSSSVAASHISLLDDPDRGYEKVKAAQTGGRETAELHRELGGRPDECPVYELYAYLLAGDDDEYATRAYEECARGDRLCGDCKEEAALLMKEFLSEHQEKREELKPVLDEVDIELETTRF